MSPDHTFRKECVMAVCTCYSYIAGNTDCKLRLQFFPHRNQLTSVVINMFIHSSMVPQLFFGPWPLLQFRNLFYSDGTTPWTSDRPISTPLPKHRITQTQNKLTHRHPYLEWGSNEDPSAQASEESSCLRPRGHCDRLAFERAETVHALDRAATVTG
jgi:hypothetical protein